MGVELVAGEIVHACHWIGGAPMAGMLTVSNEATPLGGTLDQRASISDYNILQLLRNHYATIMQLAGKYQATSRADREGLPTFVGGAAGASRCFCGGFRCRRMPGIRARLSASRKELTWRGPRGKESGRGQTRRPKAEDRKKPEGRNPSGLAAVTATGLPLRWSVPP
jgi:hypothetical protein